MSVTAAIMAGAAALSAGAATASTVSAGKLNRKNRRWQEKMYKQQVADRRQDAESQFNRQKELAAWAYQNYDSPAAQRAAMRAAGMNPFVEGSAIQPMQVDPGSAQSAQGGDLPSQGPYQNEPMSNIQPGAASLFQLGLQRKQMENIDADIALKDANRIKTLAEAQGQENTNSLFEFAKSAAESDALSKRFRVELDKVNSEFAQAFAEADLDQRKALLQEIWSRVKNNLSQAARTDADRLTIDTLRDLQAKSLGAGISLTQAQTATESSKQSNIEASTKLTDAQRETEDALRDGRIRLTNQQANEILASIGLSEARSLNEYEQLIKSMTGTQPASSMWSYLDRLIARGDSRLGGYENASDLRVKLAKALAKYIKTD